MIAYSRTSIATSQKVGEESAPAWPESTNVSTRAGLLSAQEDLVVQLISVKRYLTACLLLLCTL
jgi:hypothetical protein